MRLQPEEPEYPVGALALAAAAVSQIKHNILSLHSLVTRLNVAIPFTVPVTTYQVGASLSPQPTGFA